MDKIYRKIKLLSILLFFLSIFFGMSTPSGAQGRDSLLVVVNRPGEMLSVFKAQGTSLTPVTRLPVGKDPREVCVSPDGNLAFVSNLGGDSVTVIDLNDFKVVRTITDPRIFGPDGGIVNADSTKLYVTSARRNSVVVIPMDTFEVETEIPTGGIAPRRLAFSPGEKQLWVGHNKSPYVSVIDMESLVVVRLIQVGQEPRGGVTFTKDGKYFLVGNVEDDTVSVIDPQTYEVVRTMGVNLSPQRIEIKHDGEYAFVLCGMEAVFVMPLSLHHDESARIDLGYRVGAQWCTAQNADGSLLYISNRTQGTIQIIDTETLKIVNTVPAGERPNGIAFRK